MRASQVRFPTRGFVFGSSSSNALHSLALVRVASLAADEGFVRFAFAGQQLLERSRMQSESNPVNHEPCRLLSDPESAVNLIRTDAAFAVHNEPNSGQPLIKNDGGILKNGAQSLG